MGNKEIENALKMSKEMITIVLLKWELMCSEFKKINKLLRIVGACREKNAYETYKWQKPGL